MFERYFGKKTEDKIISFNDALEILVDLQKKNAQPIKLEYVITAATNKPVKEGNPTYDRIHELLKYHIAPYKLEKELKQDTKIRYIKRVYPSYEIHKLDFQELTEDKYRRGKMNKGHTLKVEILYKYKE